jgi:hypothetical protein
LRIVVAQKLAEIADVQPRSVAALTFSVAHSAFANRRAPTGMIRLQFRDKARLLLKR